MIKTIILSLHDLRWDGMEWKNVKGIQNQNAYTLKAKPREIKFNTIFGKKCKQTWSMFTHFVWSIFSSNWWVSMALDDSDDIPYIPNHEAVLSSFLSLLALLLLELKLMRKIFQDIVWVIEKLSESWHSIF